MINDETRKKFVEESNSYVTRRLVEAYDEAETNQENDTVQIILNEALAILKERLDEAEVD